MMITVDCKDVDAVKFPLAVHVAEQIEAIPNIKLHEFVLSPSDDKQELDVEEITKSIKAFLGTIGKDKDFAVIPKKGDQILISSLKGERLDENSRFAYEGFTSDSGFPF